MDARAVKLHIDKTRRRILALDSAKRTGWAVVDAVGLAPWRFVKSGVLKVEDAKVVREFAEHFCRSEVETVAIEDPYLGKNVRTMKSLVETRTRFQHEFEVHGVRTILVPPSDWQMGLLKGWISSRSPRQQRKKAAADYARRAFPDVKIGGFDESDAICMALWTIRAGL